MLPSLKGYCSSYFTVHRCNMHQQRKLDPVQWIRLAPSNCAELCRPSRVALVCSTSTHNLQAPLQLVEISGYTDISL